MLSRQNHRELEDNLEIWRNALNRIGLKVSRSKTEYLKAGGVEDEEELKLQGEKIKRERKTSIASASRSVDLGFIL